MQITGGGATTPATAVANLNGSGGISGITITNPGSGYTSAPTITLVGGGGSGTTLGAPSVAAVSSGGMSYTGFGKTTLTGANTYTGLSTITGGGTLSVTGSLAGGVTVTSGKLDGTGSVGATTVANDFSSGVANGNGGAGRSRSAHWRSAASRILMFALQPRPAWWSRATCRPSRPTAR